MNDLFPSDMQPVIDDLLFCAVDWLSLAKLHIQTDTTLWLLERCTTDLASLCCKVRRLTQHLKMGYLPSEVRTRQRRTPTASSETTRRHFNFATIKYHMPADLVRAIILFGTTDSYTTSIVS